MIFKNQIKKNSLVCDPHAPDWADLFKTLSEQAIDDMLRRYYSVPMVKADTPLEDTPFVSVDFETTGLNSNDDLILTIGLVPLTIDRIRCAGSAHWIVNPNRALNSESVVIHGITDSDVIHAPQISQVLGDFLDAIAGKIVLVHYKSIERTFLNAAITRCIGEGIKFPVVDTLDIEYALQIRECRGFFNRLIGKKPGSVRLGDVRKRYGLPMYPPHHALTDALATAELFQAQVQHHFCRTTLISDLWQ
ncbi:3'-5' exonuclease [Aeromonas salmonicida]|uniref:3'-5' exonuclease n=1 Tax=Aeromonas salmonicida TaxID=645 RepID=UPI00223EFC0E|nr:3'-5' exonuclease [Aeromonas salmonicida]